MDNLITRSEFDLLYQLLKIKLIEKSKDKDFKLPTKERKERHIEIIGGGKYAAMKDHFSMKDLKPGGETSAIYFYNLWRGFGVAAIDKLPVTEASIDPYFELVGFKGISDFREKIANEADTITYKCFYFSFPHGKVCDFSLALTKSLIGIKASSIGFPASDTSTGNASSIKLEGDIDIIDKCLFIYLSNGKYYLTLHIHSVSEVNRTKGLLPIAKVLQGFAAGTAAMEHPVSLECVLIREDMLKVTRNKKNVDVDFAEKFLTLKRDYHRVIAKPNNEATTSKLRVNNILVSEIAQMANCAYRIWTYSLDRKKIMQSKFEIKSDYSSIITTPYREDLTCSLTINSGANFRLLVPAYKNNYLAIYAILNIPPPNKPDGIVQGAFCTVGNHEHNPVANYFVMCKDDRKKFEADIIDVSEIIKEAKTNEKLKDLKATLDEVYRQR